MLQTMAYKAKQFNLSDLQGISNKTLEMHFKLYEGYVKSVNELNEKIAEMLKDGSRPGRVSRLFGTDAATRIRIQRHGSA
jgi:hypothetical protein